MPSTNRTWLALGAAIWLAAAPAVAAGGKRRPISEREAAAGASAYARECAACHGERGDGAGPAAPFLDPKPRDFTKGRFKYRTTISGRPPATGDILRTIDRGLPGAVMPAFSFLPSAERRRIAGYVLKLAGLLDTPEPRPVPKPKRAPAASPDSAARGRQLFEKSGCASCHGAGGKGDGTSAKDLKDEQGRPIKPRDFTVDEFRGGSTREDLFVRLMTGIDGTPMPSYDGAIEEEEIWPIIDFVLSLKAPAEPRPLPLDPVEAGREVAARYGCRPCHVMDDGAGGDVGPDLRASGRERGAAWLRRYLKEPRRYGQATPGRPYRMPDFQLDEREVEVLVEYLLRAQDGRATIVR